MSTRLSPAASLLRNSKLFALPTQIPLPPVPPSAEPVNHSDTASSIYPQYASIATPRASGLQGDWGLKRPLPTKAATKTNNPYIRLMRGIDSKEHVADFESAADHTLTLKKFQELNQHIAHEVPTAARGSSTIYGNFATRASEDNVFRSTHDNTTNMTSTAPAYTKATGTWPQISPEQMKQGMPDLIAKRLARVEQLKAAEQEVEGEPVSARQEADRARLGEQPIYARRWRYAGPSLTQMTGAEFDDYLFNLGDKERALLKEAVVEKIQNDRALKAMDNGDMHVFDKNAPVSEEQVRAALRRLRSKPQELGPMLAKILDMPEGAVPDRGGWTYGRDTLATATWQRTGPPKTHPSAGLSYMTGQQFAENHAKHGPQNTRTPVVGRFLKNKNDRFDVGSAGFVVKDNSIDSSGGLKNYQRDDHLHPAGQNFPVEVQPSYVNTNGALQLHIRKATDGIWHMRGSKIIHAVDAYEQEDKEALQKLSTSNQSMPRFPIRREGGAVPSHRRNARTESLSPDELLEFQKKGSRASLASRNVEL